MDLPKRTDKKEEGVTMIYNMTFSSLEMEMFWDKKSGEMKFKVFQKPNQALKYVDVASTYRTTTFKSTANGVFTHLARLTSNRTTNQNL
eukprot:9737522-Ditylum_brightwellii.AAC.1